jgi:ribonuclease-3
MGDMSLLDRALTHASALAEGASADYESLEFVGDAALGLAVAHYVYSHSPSATPGNCSQMRARVVNRGTLAQAARRIDLAPDIRLGKGEESSGGRHRDALLADCLEAVIGAVYLDSGWDTARQLIERILSPELNAVLSAGDELDARSRLQQHCQAQGWALPTFEVVSEEGPDHAKVFAVEVSVEGAVWGRGRGRSKKEAEQEAARVALHTQVESNEG